jgi:mediator of RNA polymerase II transcription subunit 8
VIRSDKTPIYRNRILLPLTLAPDRDEQLLMMTEGRVQAFNHDMCPDYLRTKPDPEVELKEQQTLLKAMQITPENAVKQIASSNKIVNTILGKFRSLFKTNAFHLI